jgi:hypothetical protein
VVTIDIAVAAVAAVALLGLLGLVARILVKDRRP